MKASAGNGGGFSLERTGGGRNPWQNSVVAVPYSASEGKRSFSVRQDLGQKMTSLGRDRVVKEGLGWSLLQ
jgi:hypothetical protein